MAILTLSRSVTIECAHHLPKMPDGHKCRRVHGHTYRITITCRGELGEDGLVFDNARIDDVLAHVRSTLDHRNLNDLGLPGLSDNPTAERLALWIWGLAKACVVVGPALHRITIREGERSVFEVREGDVD